MVPPENAGGGDDDDNSSSDDDDDREVIANRPDIIITNKQEKACILTDVPIPVDRNVMQERAKKNIIQEFMNRAN